MKRLKGKTARMKEHANPGPAAETLSETEFQKEFLRFAHSDRAPHYLRGNRFVREVPLSYDPGAARTPKDPFSPSIEMDFVELDRHGKLHLWEAKLLHSDPLIKGKILGQMMFYDFLARTHYRDVYLDVLERRGVPREALEPLRAHESLPFTTWNILVLGGDGWELAAGVNPIMWTYPTIRESYFSEQSPTIAIYHFYKVSDGYDLRNIWNLSIFAPTGMHPDAYAKYLAREEHKQPASVSRADGASQPDSGAECAKALDPEQLADLLELNDGIDEDTTLRLIGRHEHDIVTQQTPERADASGPVARDASSEITVGNGTRNDGRAD